MSGMIAYCGLVCSSCPQFLATKIDNDVAREKTAAFLAKKFGLNLKPEDINCDGCLAVGGRLLDFCMTCEIKKCCSKKGLENCTVCNEQPCKELVKLHEFSPGAKAAFDSLKNGRPLEETPIWKNVMAAFDALKKEIG